MNSRRRPKVLFKKKKRKGRKKRKGKWKRMNIKKPLPLKNVKAVQLYQCAGEMEGANHNIKEMTQLKWSFGAEVGRWKTAADAKVSSHIWDSLLHDTLTSNVLVHSNNEIKLNLDISFFCSKMSKRYSSDNLSLVS